MRFLYIEEEVDHIAVFHDVFLALGAQEAFFFGCGERTADFHEFIVSDGLRADKAFLKVCVNLARCLRCFGAAAYCPRAAFVFSGSQERNQIEQGVGGFD